MNRFSLLLVFFSFFALCLQAQITDIAVGKPYAVVDAENKFYFAKGKEILTVKIDRKMVTLQKLRSDNLTFEKTKLYDDFGKDFVIENVTEIGGRYYVFYSLWDGENEQLFGREINFKEGAFFTKGVKLFSVNHKLAGDVVSTGFYRFTTLGKFSFTVSGDSSTVLIQYRLKPDVKRDSKSYDIIGMNVYDHSMKEMWRKEVTMPYTEKKMNNLDYTVDRKGNAYLIVRVFDDKQSSKKEDEENPGYTIEILKVSAATKELTQHPMNVPSKFLRTLRIYESPKGDLIAAGYYNKDKDANTADGVFVFNVSKDMKITNTATHEIPLEILNQNASGKVQRKNDRKEGDDKAEFADISLSDINIEPDGSLMLVGEQYYVKAHYNYSPTGGTTITYTYHYNDLLVTKILPSGKLAWMKKLPKRQVGGRGRGGMSFRYYDDGKDYYFIYLDNEKNLDLPADKVPSKHVDGQGGFLTVYKVNGKTGETSKTLVLDTRDVKGTEVYQFAPSRIVNTGKMEFVFEAYKKKKEDIMVRFRL